MKIRVQRGPFLKGCRLIDRALPERLVQPAFGRLLLQARENTCILQVVGTDVGLRLEVPAVVEEAGEALLPARQALSVVREATAEELSLESRPGRVRARGEGAEFLLETPSWVQPAFLDPFPGGACHQLPPDLLGQAIRRTLFAVGRQTPRYRLQGVLWEVEADQVRLVTSDNKRLAVAVVPAQGPEEDTSRQQRLLPARAVDLLARLAEDEREAITAQFGVRHAFFRVGSATLCARLLDGPFPDWRRAVPADPHHLLPLPVGAFLTGVRQAAALRDKEDARLWLRFQPGWVQMESRQEGAGQSRVRLPLPLAGGRVEIALNPGFLVALCRAFDAESILLLHLTDQDSPAVFSDGDNSYLHILMPLRTA